jgi:hypothetical protein
MFSIQKLIGRDEKFYDLLEASAQQADTSVHQLIALQAVVQWQYLNPGQKGNDGLYSILGGLNYYIRGDNLKLMVNYIHTWSDFRQANPEFGEDQFDEVIGRMQLMF